MIEISKTPSLVHRSPIYYGWVVWAVATMGLIATAPGQSFTVSLFFDHYIADFGLSRTAISGLYGLGTFLAAMSLTWVGRLIDHHGNRRMVTIIAGLFALSLVGMSLVTGPLMLFIGFVAIRGLGQGSLGLSNTTVIAQWFKSRRGQMISLTFVGFSLFQAAYIPWLEHLLSIYDWRQVWLILAALVGLIAVPALWLFIRNRPEDYGLLPDNEVVKVTTDQAAAVLDEENWTLNEARRTAIFWVYALGRMLTPAWGTGLIIHQVSLFDSLGYEAGIAARTYSVFAMLAAFVSLGSGVLVDRVRPGIVMVLQVGSLMMTMGIATLMTESWMLYAYAVTFALSMGIGAVFDGAVWPNLFGRLYQGAIRGFVATIMVVGTAIGPIIFGWCYDTFGSYDPVLWVGVLLSLPPMILSLTVQKPERR